MRLVFYGGGDQYDNREVDEKLLKTFSLKPSAKMAFIPASSYDSEVDFKYFVEQYKYFGFRKFLHFPIDISHRSLLAKELFDVDRIHLGGGNTFEFLAVLRHFGFLSKLRKFAERGGVLTGLSAGAIIMAPTIMTASFPDFDCDSNDVNITDFRALNLVDFEFFPHYQSRFDYMAAMKNYTKTIKRPLYACPDGEAVFVIDKTIEATKGVSIFSAGVLLE